MAARAHTHQAATKRAGGRRKCTLPHGGRSAHPAALPEPPPEHDVTLAQHLAGGGGGLDAANEHAPLPRLHGMGEQWGGQRL